MRVLSVGTFCNTLGFTVSFPYLPLMVRGFGVQEGLETWVGVIVGGFFTVSFLMAPVWGGLADHFGRKSMVLRAGLGMSVGFCLLAFTGTLPWFLVFFILVGTCNGYVPAAIALVATNTPTRHMGRAISTVQSGALLGTTYGPAIGAFLATALPAYHQLFWISSAMSLCGGLLALIAVKERLAPPAGRFRLTVFQAVRQLLKVPSMGLLYFLSFIFSITMFGSTTIIALYTIDIAGEKGLPLGLSLETWVGTATLALTIASAVSLPFWGRALDRLEPGRILAVAMLAGALASLWLPWVRNPLELTGARIVLGLFAVGILPSAVRLIKALAPPGMDARSLALGTGLQMLGNGAAPFFAGMIGPVLGLRAYFACNSILLGCGFLLWASKGISGVRGLGRDSS